MALLKVTTCMLESGLDIHQYLVFTYTVVRSHALVNQFPYEACLVRKDLLPQTLRRLHSASSAAGAQEQHPVPISRNAQLCMCVAGGLGVRRSPADAKDCAMSDSL